MGRCDDGAHSQNEKIDIANYIEGVSESRWLVNAVSARKILTIISFSFFFFQTKVMASYLYEVGLVGKSKAS